MSTTVGAILEAERESAKAAIGLALRQASLDLPSNPSPPANVHAVGRVSHPAKPYSIGEIRDRARA